VRAGWISGEIARAAYEEQQRVERGEKIVVGVNRHQLDDEPQPRIFRLDASLAAAVAADLAKLRASRDAEAVAHSLDALKAAASGTSNLFPVVLACVESGATIGEVCRTLESVWGPYRAAGN